MGKTTVVLDDKLLKTAMLLTKAKTKKKVIEEGLKEIIRKNNIKRLKESIGKIEINLTYEELMRQRDGK